MNDEELDKALKQAFNSEHLPEKNFRLAGEIPLNNQKGWNNLFGWLWVGRIAAAFCFFTFGFTLAKLGDTRVADQSPPMEDAVSAYDWYTQFGSRLSGGERSHVLQWFSMQARQDINPPDLDGFKLSAVEPLTSSHGAALLLVYSGANNEPLLLFVREDSNQREQVIRWRRDRPQQIAYFYQDGLAYAMSYGDAEVLKTIAFKLHGDYI